MVDNDGQPTYLTVRETARRLAVHENTVRNWVRDGILPTAKVPGSRFHRFDARDVERLRRQRGSAFVSVEQERRTIGPELADATQLSRWAETRDAQTAFPELVRRLLAATPGITNISARSGEGVALSGWDGRADSVGTAFLPSGSLRLELGVGTKVAAKAEEDYEKRRVSPNAQEVVFVFMTPRRWRDGGSWAEAKARLKDFADVRVLDADDLEGWLVATPAVHQWISEQLGRKPDEAQTLEQWWEQFRASTNPPLPSKLFLAGRDREASSVKDFLNGPPGALAVQADWRDEAIAFIAATLACTDLNLAGPAVIVHSKAVWDRMLSQSGRVTLIPLFETPDLARARESGRHVISPLGRDQVITGAPLVLPRLDRLGAVQALEADKVPHERAYHLAAQARRSMPALIRKLATDQNFARPPWTEPQYAAVLAPLILVGSWTDSEGDRDIATKMANESWYSIERTLLHWSATNDPPFVRTGDQWHLASSEEAFLVLGHLLTRDDLSRWHQVAVDVITEVDPVLDLSIEERPMAGIRGVCRQHSSVLRRGMADGIALVGSHENQRMSDASTAAEHADAIVREILQRANQDASGRIWWALSDVLPLLAEASPTVFLDAVHDDLDSDQPLLRTMFQDHDHTSWLSSSSPHTGLLWALERLCWSPEHILPASRALARLQVLDPGGRLGNRPLGSLQAVLVPWIRHTAAPLDLKVRSVATICREVPDVGWDLVLGLWPSNHGTAMPPAAPRYRDWSPESRGVPISEWLDYVAHLVTLSIELANGRPDRWAVLSERFGPVPPADRDRLLGALDNFVQTQSLDHDQRLSLWEKIRNEVARHRQFATAEWSMDEAVLTRMQTIADRVEPTGRVERFGHLFDWRPRLSDTDNDDNEVYEAKLLRLRKQAVIETLATSSLDGLEALAAHSPVPGHLGWTLGMVASKDMTPKLLPWLNNNDKHLLSVARGWASYKLSDLGTNWLSEILSLPQMKDPERRLQLALCAPSTGDVWDVLTALDPGLSDAYWKTAAPLAVQPRDAARAATELLRHDRAWMAVDLLASALHQGDQTETSITPDIVQDVLTTALTANPTEAKQQSVGYELGVLLDYLEARAVEPTKLAQYEFVFFNLIEHNRKPRALFAALANDPSMFVDLARRVYRGKNELEKRVDERERALANHAWWVMRHWRALPGLRDDKTIDSEHLKKWVHDARFAFAESDRADIGDELIGQVLAASPRGDDEIWPAEAVREIIETIGSQNMESGIHTGVINDRGVTSRGVFDGGKQEWDIAARYRDFSQRTSAEWPRTSRILRRLAEDYERQARRNDIEAAVRADTE